MIRLRQAKKDDRLIRRLIYKELIPLTRFVQPNDPSTRTIIRERLKRGTAWVAIPGSNENLVGFINIFLEGNHTLYVDMLAVDPKHRKHGWGRQLLLHGEEYARKSGCNQAYLYVDAGNTAGISFYHRLGYEIAGYNSIIECYRMAKTFYQKYG